MVGTNVIVGVIYSVSSVFGKGEGALFHSETSVLVWFWVTSWGDLWGNFKIKEVGSCRMRRESELESWKWKYKPHEPHV